MTTHAFAAGEKNGETQQTKTSRHAADLQGSVLTSSSPPEEVVVRADGVQSANGVTNLTPGGGLMPVQTAPRSQSGVTRDFIAKQSPISSPSLLVANLAGVVVADTDPLGLTPERIYMRGMNETQIGYLFEGTPVADPINYEPKSFMLVDTENLSGISVAQGSPDLNAPVFNATGGMISVSEINPSHHSGGFIDLAGGTHSTQKEFLRLETGDIGRSGVRGFVSYSYEGTNLWRGPGSIGRHHVDSKFEKDWGDDNSIKTIFGLNREHFTNFRNPTLAQWNASGTSLNYLGSYTPGNSLYYRLNGGENNMEDVIVPVQMSLTDNLKFHASAYYIHQFGPSQSGEAIPEQGGYFGTSQYGNLEQPYVTNGKITTQAVDPWNQREGSLNTSLDWSIGHNTLSFGYWYSYTVHTEEQSFSTLNYDGVPKNSFGRYPILVNGRVLSGYNLNFMQQVNALYLADTYKALNDRLTLSAGFRTVMVERQGTDDLPGADPYKNKQHYFAPLPQLAASYQITPRDQLYFNATTSFRAPASVEAYNQLFDPNTKGPTEQPSALKSEYSIAEEIGYRHNGFVRVAASLFNINITNHQVTSAGYIPGTNQIVTTPLDVGGQTSRGAQIELGLRPWHGFSPYLSAEYLHSVLDNNFNAGVDYLPTAGKTSVASPEFTGSIGLSYDNGSVFGNFALRYVDSQYSTFMDNQKIPSYVTSDLTLGYRLHHAGPLKSPQIQLNVLNVGDNHYLSAPAGISGTATAMRGIFGNLVAASQPTYVIAPAVAAIVSISAGF